MELPALARSNKLCLVPLLLAVAISLASTETTALAPSPSPSPSPAPAPAPAYVNITQVLVSAGDFSTFVGFLGSSGVGEKFQNQANNTDVGITIFAPKDKAFQTEPALTLLKGISAQQLIALLEYHALNNWQSLAALQHSSDNVTSTFASYNAGGGKYVLNVTFVKGQVEIITEWNRATTTSTLYNARPVSIFAIEQVLLPVDIFGLPSPAPAPSPSSGAPSGAPSSSSSSSSSGSSGPSASHSLASLSSPPPSLLSLLIISFLLFNLF